MGLEKALAGTPANDFLQACQDLTRGLGLRTVEVRANLVGPKSVRVELTLQDDAGLVVTADVVLSQGA